jgi:hypothetical protein
LGTEKGNGKLDNKTLVIWKLQTGNYKLETRNWKPETKNWKMETGEVTRKLLEN